MTPHEAPLHDGPLSGAPLSDAPVLGAPVLEVRPDRPILAHAIADRFLEVAETARAEGCPLHVALTGGSMGAAFLMALAAASPAPGSLAHVHLWWGDERYEPAGSAERNETQALEALGGAWPVPPENIHPMPVRQPGVTDTGPTADAGGDALRYASALADAVAARAATGEPALDLVMLGLGPDGHVASLFPGHPATAPSSCSVVSVQDSPKPPPVRLSLTFEALCAADRVWLMVSGEDKAAAVATAYRAGARPARGEDSLLRAPGGSVRGTQETVWWLDEAASAQLPTAALGQ